LCRADELKADKREAHLKEVKYREDTRSGHQLEAFSKQHRTLYCRRMKAKKVALQTILLGVGGSIYTSNTLHIFKRGLDSHRIHKIAHSTHFAHKSL